MLKNKSKNSALKLSPKLIDLFLKDLVLREKKSLATVKAYKSILMRYYREKKILEPQKARQFIRSHSTHIAPATQLL